MSIDFLDGYKKKLYLETKYGQLSAEFLELEKGRAADLFNNVDPITAEERRLVLFSLFLKKKVDKKKLSPEEANIFLGEFISKEQSRQAGRYSNGINFGDFSNPEKRVEVVAPNSDPQQTVRLEDLVNKHKPAFSSNIILGEYFNESNKISRENARPQLSSK